MWSVYQTGGHLGAGMGVVELTVVLHYLMNTPYDRLVWDVGHQCYPHKILTGRREQMATLRAQDGLKGFPSREESPYDAFGTGHSSTALSAALGMAEAAAQQGEKRRVVAVVGDGALTGGMAYEALCDGGANRSDVLVVLKRQPHVHLGEHRRHDRVPVAHHLVRPVLQPARLRQAAAAAQRQGQALAAAAGGGAQIDPAAGRAL